MRLPKWLVIGTVVCFLFALTAGNAALAAERIRAIEVRGNLTIPTETILATIRSKAGGPFVREWIDADIKTLYKLGQFTDIRVERRQAGDGVTLVYHVVEKPTITAIRFEGNRKFKQKELLNEVTVRTYQPISEEALADSMQRLQELYTKKGFHLVDIEYALEAAEEGQTLVFRIREHGKSAVRRIQFIGNKAFRDGDLKKVLRTKERGALLFRRGRYREDQIEQDVALLTLHYLNHGYLRVRLDTPRVEMTKDKQHLFVTFAVDEGKQYRIANLRVEGDILTTPEELIARLKTAPKTLYKHSVVEEDLRMLTELYGAEGYAFANIQPMPIPNDAEGTADLVFHVSKGRRVHIDRIQVLGNTVTRDKVIRRELKVKEGDLFNRRLIEESRERLMQLGYFEEVKFATPRGSGEDTVNLTVEVKEKPTGTFNIGAGFSTSESFFFTGSVQKQNFFGLGISGQIAAEISKLRQQYVLEFTDPYFLDTAWIFSLSTSRTIFRYPDYDRKAYGGSISLGHRFFEKAAVNVGYRWEKVEAASFSFVVPNIFQQNAKGITSAATFSLSYDNRDNRIFPSKGIFTAATAELAGSKLGGDVDFLRLNYNLRYYQPIRWGLVSKIYGKVGFIKSLGTNSIPLFERYFLGGPNSLRGFNLWTVGPQLRIPSTVTGGDTNFVYGGNKMLQLNWELEFPIYAPAGLKLVTFVDAGNAFAEDEGISLKNLRANYGAGIRWISPLGPLRFEWGLPFRKRTGEPGVVFNFTVGEFF
ncbi:MAG: outer membrane protein assembly factor BamA [Deltaproteobacteria bacterium]|nr:outer membrane protein assembly factor BamA [Deltaproteobacteria bacterium]